MNSSLKATVLEYIYKWTEKGWDTQVSELYSSPRRQTQDKLCKYQTPVPTRAENAHGTHTVIFVGGRPCRKRKKLLFTFKNMLLFWREKALRVTAGSFPFNVTSDNVGAISPSLEIRRNSGS